MSAKFKHSIIFAKIVRPRVFDCRKIDKLAVFDNQVLTICGDLYVCGTNGTYISTIDSPEPDWGFSDAAWLSRDRIVCTHYKNQMLQASLSGNITVLKSNISVSVISVSKDGAIYGAAGKQGVLTSSDGGDTWSTLMLASEGWAIRQVIKVQLNNGSLSYWMLERNNSNHWRLRIHYNDTSTGCEVFNYNQEYYKSLDLAYEEHSNTMFLADRVNRTVHMFDVTGCNYSGVLQVTGIDMKKTKGPRSMAIDNKLLYLGTDDIMIHVLELDI